MERVTRAVRGTIVRVTTETEPRIAPRTPLLGQAAAAAALGGLLLALASGGASALVAGIALVQLLAVLGFLAVTEAPAAPGIFGIGLLAAVASDVIVLADDGAPGHLAGVVGLAVVVGILHQLARRDRSRVTEALADTLVVVMLVTAAAGLAAAFQQAGGEDVVRVALLAATVALVAGRAGDLVVQKPALAVGSTRAWPGLLLGLGAGTAVSALLDTDLTPGRAVLVGLVAAAAVAAVDLMLDLAAAELTVDHADARRVAALRPTSLCVPFALLGPVALAAVRFLE